MNNVLVITNNDSDFLKLLRAKCSVTVASDDAVPIETDGFDALCVLGGADSTDVIMSAPLHNFAIKMKEEGKPVFFEFVGALFTVRKRKVHNTARQRMVYRASGLECDGITDGDLLDGQCNDCLEYSRMDDSARPILTYRENICAHSRTEISEQEHREGVFALWWYNESTLVSSIRISNFHRARFAPRVRWQSLVGGIISFLAGERVTLEPLPSVYTYRQMKINSARDADETVMRGIEWIEKSDILRNDGHSGAKEGFSNRISAMTGEQRRNDNVRADCTNEIGGALAFHAYLSGNEKSRERANALFDYTFNHMQIKQGEHCGMLRWSEVGWDDCYQDDVARAVIPPLMCQFFDTRIPHLDDIKSALDYLVATTAKDGIRTPCTTTRSLTPERRAHITGEHAAEPCAHFNAFYHAALLLAYRACGDEKYLDYATRGLTTLMSRYPETRRETSETEEYCRLIFPLAVLYGVTGSDEHYGWLCRVTEDIGRLRHEFGGYAEWDTGYKAGCSRNHNGECALLADNGDPVADLLYSNNWLPLGFAYAYFVTGDDRYHRLWSEIASFMASAQMYSDTPHLDGAWARAFDMDTRENCGMPHDKGWGPHCIESGWTVGEILMGLQFMHAAEKQINPKGNNAAFEDNAAKV